MSNDIHHKLTVTGSNAEAVIAALGVKFADMGQELKRTQSDTMTYFTRWFFPSKQISEVSRLFPENTIHVEYFDMVPAPSADAHNRTHRPVQPAPTETRMFVREE
jgi:hypothetical protein